MISCPGRAVSAKRRPWLALSAGARTLVIETITDCWRRPLTDSVVASCGRSGASWPESRAQDSEAILSPQVTYRRAQLSGSARPKKLGWHGGAPGRDASRRSSYRPAATGGAGHLARHGPPQRAPAQRPHPVCLARPDGAGLQPAQDREGPGCAGPGSRPPPSRPGRPPTPPTAVVPRGDPGTAQAGHGPILPPRRPAGQGARQPHRDRDDVRGETVAIATVAAAGRGRAAPSRRAFPRRRPVTPEKPLYTGLARTAPWRP
jgi:hypothetical protein